MVFLLVEDSRPTRNLIKSYLGELDLCGPSHFKEAENCEEALRILENFHIDFALVDMNLSTRMTGLDLLKEIRKSEKNRQIPVVMVTSESDKVTVIEALKCGANDFVAKPIDKKSFEAKIHKIIG